MSEKGSNIDSKKMQTDTLTTHEWDRFLRIQRYVRANLRSFDHNHIAQYGGVSKRKQDNKVIEVYRLFPIRNYDKTLLASFFLLII